jgi:hypothetical protein
VVADGNCGGWKPSTSQSCTSNCSGSSSQTCPSMWNWGSSYIVETTQEDAWPCLEWSWFPKSWSCTIWDIRSYESVPVCSCPKNKSWSWSCISTLVRYVQNCN